jgi:PIN domain nuclease of toxin-antitoxin system
LRRHRTDLFDRVLIAHALQADLDALTRDAAFAAYGVRLAEA